MKQSRRRGFLYRRTTIPFSGPRLGTTIAKEVALGFDREVHRGHRIGSLGNQHVTTAFVIPGIESVVGADQAIAVENAKWTTATNNIYPVMMVRLRASTRENPVALRTEVAVAQRPENPSEYPNLVQPTKCITLLAATLRMTSRT
jgi:hypothetical protein